MVKKLLYFLWGVYPPPREESPPKVRERKKAVRYRFYRTRLMFLFLALLTLFSVESAGLEKKPQVDTNKVNTNEPTKHEYVLTQTSLTTSTASTNIEEHGDSPLNIFSILSALFILIMTRIIVYRFPDQKIQAIIIHIGFAVILLCFIVFYELHLSSLIADNYELFIDTGVGSCYGLFELNNALEGKPHNKILGRLYYFNTSLILFLVLNPDSVDLWVHLVQLICVFIVAKVMFFQCLKAICENAIAE
ncbi:MAG: hypothetical protein H6551_02990 [Chitinophagales bacterium]|nr:hypothetical protein [Chitinophagaceae bacterium]MCB9064090.1 hypothetical protein [Chitinophagales bacterium]